MAQETLFHKIHRIEIVSNQLAKDLLAGAYHSAFKGRGIEFEEVRPFQTGDDPRTVDWNVTARMNQPYIKNFREERDLSVLLIVDVSASLRFGTHNGLKSDLVAELGAVLAFSAIRNNDKIGLLLFSDQVEKYIPPRKGTRHVLRLIRELLVFKPAHRGSDLKKTLAFVGHLPIRSAICFILSDFLFPALEKKELALTKTKHDLIAISINDPAEFKFPLLNLVHLKDLENGRSDLVDFQSARLNTSRLIEAHKNLLSSIGVDFLEIKTNQSYPIILRKFFKKRRAKHS